MRAVYDHLGGQSCSGIRRHILCGDRAGSPPRSRSSKTRWAGATIAPALGAAAAVGFKNGLPSEHRRNRPVGGFGWPQWTLRRT
jgi:hypothetical protein